MPDVSVIIPVYGEHESQRSLATVTSAWLAQNTSCEVVVATAGEIPVSVAEEIDRQRRVRVVRAGPHMAAPGLLRNVGASRAGSRWLYLSDADVAPLGRDYLSRTLRLAADGAFCQPWMYRLPYGVDALASQAVVDCQVTGSGQFCFVTPDSSGQLLQMEGERLVWRAPDPDEDPFPRPMVLAPNATLDPSRSDRHQWRAPFHWGAVLIKARTFSAVAGYCARYRGWGREDDDLLVKVGARGNVMRGWQVEPSLTCLHFEHSLPYAGSEQERANDALYEQRLAEGAEAMIKADFAACATNRPQF
jgi:hypothetical protein